MNCIGYFMKALTSAQACLYGQSVCQINLTACLVKFVKTHICSFGRQ